MEPFLIVKYLKRRDITQKSIDQKSRFLNLKATLFLVRRSNNDFLNFNMAITSDVCFSKSRDRNNGHHESQISLSNLADCKVWNACGLVQTAEAVTCIFADHLHILALHAFEHVDDD